MCLSARSSSSKILKTRARARNVYKKSVNACCLLCRIVCFCIAVCFEISKTEKREREETGEDQTQQRDAAKLFVAQ